jgi:ABC-2 type transport system ATP-binding protein
MLQFQQVEKYYGSHLALSIPDIELKKGLYWVQGENGSGKTTMLKMVAGLHTFKGDIWRDKIHLKKERTLFLRGVNYAEAEPLYPTFLTAKDLITLYCETRKVDPKNALEQLEQLHISHAYQDLIGTYSSGMIKKLSLVLAFIGKPSWIMLDEPLITIDVAAVDTVSKWINQLYKEAQVSFLITSHQSFQTALHFTGNIQVANQSISYTAL